MGRIRHPSFFMILLLGLLLCTGVSFKVWATEAESVQSLPVFTENYEPEAEASETDESEVENGDAIGTVDPADSEANPIDSEDNLIATEANPTDSEANPIVTEANPSNTLSENTVTTCQELERWFDTHEGIGGTVYLGCSIEVNEYLCPLTSEDAPITIDTGSYSLILAGDYIENGFGFLEIVGEGVDSPVVNVQDMGSSWMGNWNFNLLNLRITATGRDGAGGTALRISAIDERKYDMTLTLDVGLIRSFGENAIGLYLAVPMEAYFFQVVVDGANSTALYAAKGASVRYTRLTANGEGAKVAEAPQGKQVVLDSCALLPLPSASAEVGIVSRHLLETSIYLPVRKGSRLSSFDLLRFQFATFRVSGSENFPETWRTFGVNWDIGKYLGIKTSVTGRTVLSGTLDPIMKDFGLIEYFSPELIVEVRDPRFPCIKDTTFSWDYGKEQPYIGLFFWDSYDPQEDASKGMVDSQGRKVILWRSDDLGATWYDVSTDPETLWHSYFVQYFFQEISAPIQLQIEVEGVGESNVVTVFKVDGEVYSGLGGDRTGPDRNIVTKPGNGPDNGPDENDPDNDPDNGPDENDPDNDPDTGAPRAPSNPYRGYYIPPLYPLPPSAGSMTTDAVAQSAYSVPVEHLPSPSDTADGSSPESVPATQSSDAALSTPLSLPSEDASNLPAEADDETPPRTSLSLSVSKENLSTYSGGSVDTTVLSRHTSEKNAGEDGTVTPSTEIPDSLIPVATVVNEETMNEETMVETALAPGASDTSVPIAPAASSLEQSAAQQKKTITPPVTTRQQGITPILLAEERLQAVAFQSPHGTDWLLAATGLATALCFLAFTVVQLVHRRS